MNIHEYQAKSILRKYGVNVSNGTAVKTAADAEKAAAELIKNGASIVVVKAQIHAGGRGKGKFKEHANGGGVKIAKTAAEAKALAQGMLGNTLVTHQTGPVGQTVKTVYIEHGSDIEKELYISLLIDRATSRVIFIASQEGGVEIEEVAEKHPEKIIKVVIDPATGFQGFHARKLAFGLGFEGDIFKQFMKFAPALYKAFIETDASQAEINPLIITQDGVLKALDAKFNFDDNALYRQKEVSDMRDEDEEEPLEREAGKHGLSYIKMDGNIGCMVNGAGLAMSTMDIIKLYGGEPANFLDVGGGATKERVTEAFKIILSDRNVQGILVNIFGGIMRCDIIAEGVIAAAKDVGLKVPLVVRLAGTNVELGKKLLNSSGLAIVSADDLADAAEKIVKAVKREAA